MPDDRPDDVRALEDLEVAVQRFEAAAEAFTQHAAPLLREGLQLRGGSDVQPPDGDA
jgi:hypothetical protein